MLVSGGLTGEWDWSEPDPWAQALGIFDLNTWGWSDKYDADADAYDSPDTIMDWYSGGYDFDLSAVSQIIGANGIAGDLPRLTGVAMRWKNCLATVRMA